MGLSDKPDLAWLYRDTRKRLTDFVRGLEDAALTAQVPCCPGWAVRDVLAHLVATPEDALAGRLTGIPSEDFTADQVARFADVSVTEMLSRWSAAGPQFEEIVEAFEMWPAVIDVASHEQDIRGALGQQGARQCAAIRAMAPLLASLLAPPVPLKVITEYGEYLVGGSDARVGPLTLSTSEFELFRWTMGRRSRDQLAAMDWSGDPSTVIGELTIFGPAVRDVRE